MAESIKDIVVRITAQTQGFESFDVPSAKLNALTQSIDAANVATGNLAQYITKAQNVAAVWGDVWAALNSQMGKFSEIAGGHAAGMTLMGKTYRELQTSGMSAAQALNVVNGSIAQTTDSMNAAGTAQLSFAQRISASAKGFETFGSFGLQAMHILDRVEISQLNVENAATSLANAQLRYNEALANGDPRDIFLANNELIRSQNNLEKANQRAALSMAAIGVSAVQTIPAIVNFATTMTKKLKEAEQATLITTTRIKAMAPELLLLSAVAGGIYYMISTQAAAAQSAQEEMAAAIAGGMENAKQKAKEYKDILEEITNTQTSSEARAKDVDMEYQAKKKAIEQAPGLTPEERAQKLDEATLERNQKLRDIRYDTDKNLLKSTKDRAAIEKDMQEIQDAKAKAELAAQERRKEGYRGLRGAYAGPQDTAQVASRVTPLNVEYAIPPALPETQKAVKIEAATAAEQALYERMGWKPEYAEPAMQTEAWKKIQENMKTIAQNPNLISDYTVQGIIPPPPAPAPLELNAEFWVTLDKEGTENIMSGNTTRILGRGVTR